VKVDFNQVEVLSSSSLSTTAAVVVEAVVKGTAMFCLSNLHFCFPFFFHYLLTSPYYVQRHKGQGLWIELCLTIRKHQITKISKK